MYSIKKLENESKGTNYETVEYQVITPKGNKLTVELWRKKEYNEFTTFEVFSKDTTNEDGLYITGNLSFDGSELTDYDGCYCLPKSVAIVLRSLGYIVADNCLTSPIKDEVVTL